METLAVVAGEQITEKELQAFLQSVPREQQAYISNPQFREQALEQLIALYMFAKEGEELKLEETEEFKSIIANARKDILAQMAMREALKDATVSEEELKAYYEANSAQYMKGETVNAKHILVAEEEKCKEILKAIEEESGSEASAAELIELIEEVEHHKLPAIFTETSGSSSAASVISRETDAAIHTLDMAMAGDSYFDAMYHNINTLKEALQ